MSDQMTADRDEIRDVVVQWDWDVQTDDCTTYKYPKKVSRWPPYNRKDPRAERYIPYTDYVALEQSRNRDLARNVLDAIDTAPKDGREVLLLVESRAGVGPRFLVGHYMPGGHCIEDHPPIEAGWYYWNGCMFTGPERPLMWMELPVVDAVNRDVPYENTRSEP